MADNEDRTLAASEKRLEQAREEGRAPMSREVVVAAGLGAAALLLVMGGPGMAYGTALRLRGMLDMTAAPGAAVRDAAWAFLAASAPLLAAVAAAASAAVLLQTRFLVHTAALLPDPARLDPRRGLSRLFGGGNLADTGKALVKLAVIAWALWSALDSVWPQLGQSATWSEAALLDHLARELSRLLLLVLGVQCGIALLDLTWTRWQHAQRLRMSREEQKQEQRESDGDPRIKARLRQLRQSRARRRMIAAVAKATVVVTNPTHYAVALSYERGGRSAPRVIAKGVDDVAARIREAATRAGVPLVANPPLARALHTVPLDAEIPAEHFRVVAEMIAYVWRLRGAAQG